MSSGLSPSSQLPMGVNLGLTYGAYLIGAIVASALYGILALQIMFYFSRYSKDRPALKLLVIALFLLDTLTVVLETHGLYHYLIVNFGNLEVLQIQVWSVQLEALVAYTIMLITQAFFIKRIWELTGRKWLLAGILTIFSLAAFGTALGTVITVFSFKFWASSLFPSVKALVASNKALETIVDAMITVALCYYLHRGRSGVQAKTNSMINRLIVFAVNRGAITTLLQLSYLIAFQVKPDSMAWVSIHVAISKVYSNSVLATLNSRNSIRGVGDDQELMSVNVTQVEFMQFAHTIGHTDEHRVMQSARTFSVSDRKRTGDKSFNSEATLPIEINLQQESHTSRDRI